MKRVISESDINHLKLKGEKILYVDKDVIITPLAYDSIKEANITVIEGQPKVKEESESTLSDFTSAKVVAIGNDHTGLEIKKKVVEFLKKYNFTVINVGTNTEQSCDFPDFAFEVAKKVALKEACFGICLDATGIPSAITANKVPGIRACTCYNEFTAKSAREHNNGNVIVLGAKALGEESIKSIIDAWINTQFAGGRHQRRLNKITEIEKQFIKGL